MATIKVKPNIAPRADGSGEVILWETTKSGGQIFITSAPDKSGKQKTYEVPDTPGVNTKIAEGRLTKIEPKEA